MAEQTRADWLRAFIEEYKDALSPATYGQIFHAAKELDENALKLHSVTEQRDTYQIRLAAAVAERAGYRKALEDIADTCGHDYYLESVGDMARAVLDSTEAPQP